ncbi:Cysteine proteinase inhibitor [Rhynchospora pubera]|uniref:Cysteine proteinase inhibitor n=1 Tax=Rhynchospora pubera TaxID=906938 RepID=A0AAV8F6V0_9POAL|nr:Cysteine proteinase inhibitor [Rhynchospora pubera]KAJ4786416.1 Cysteine proteinase inhibitor [Rhynchospora pubera]
MGSRAAARVFVFSCVLVLSMSFLASSRALIGERRGRGDPVVPGGWRDSEIANSAEIEELARFAVEEHNKKENTLLKFVRVVKAKEQVVAGIMHHFTLEAIEAGNKKLYEAKVWVKPWLHFKQLQEFKHAAASSSFSTASYLRAGHGDRRLA